MAFFKFRFPGQTATAEAVTSGPNENIDIVRRRARHRLMGAVVLVLIAVVGFPLLFDTQPRPVAVDTPIVIPDRQSTSPLTSGTPVPATQAPAKPLLPASETISPQASLDAREEVVLPAPPVVAPVPEKPKVTPPAEKTKEKETVAKKEPAVKEPSVNEETKPAVPKAEKLASAVKPIDDGGKAQALLEGKSVKGTAGRAVIQVGAFADAAKVRDVRHKLEQAGLKTYTQVVEKDGKSTTRVRVGPYETREEADKVAARIRKLDLPASVLTL